eukprot:13445553-Heterocapsa_arctica.AAC.1
MVIARNKGSVRSSCHTDCPECRGVKVEKGWHGNEAVATSVLPSVYPSARHKLLMSAWWMSVAGVHDCMYLDHAFVIVCRHLGGTVQSLNGHRPCSEPCK